MSCNDVLQAIATGQVASDIGQQIIEFIAALPGIKAAEEPEARFSALEERK